MDTLVTIFGFIGILSITAVCFHLFLDQNKIKSAFRRIQSKLKEAQRQLPDVIRAAEIKYRTKYLNDTKVFGERVETEHVNLISQAISGESSQELVQSMKVIIEKHCQRATQEFLGNISDEAEGLTRDLQFALNDKIWDSFQQYKERHDDTPYMIPRNVRIMYTKGHRTIIVIEQEPQVRTVGFSYGLVAKADIKKAVTTSANGYWFTLAFPYVYFVVVFDKEVYSNIEPFFVNERLTSVRDKLYFAPMPNVRDKIDSNTNQPHVCLGDGSGSSVRRYNTITEQSEELIRLFWSRVYSDHYGKGKFRKIDKRISTIRNWQQNSIEDPMFILSVEWKKGITLKGIIEDKFDFRDQTHEMDGMEKEVRDLLEKGVSKLTHRIREEIEGIKDSQAPKHLESQSREQLEHLLQSHTKKVFTSCRK